VARQTPANSHAIVECARASMRRSIFNGGSLEEAGAHSSTAWWIKNACKALLIVRRDATARHYVHLGTAIIIHAPPHLYDFSF